MDALESSATDSELWDLVLSEDGHAFGLIFDRHRDRVFNHGLRLVRSPHDAEDVTAVVFLEAWRCRKKVKSVNGSILGWLLVTTNNVARNCLRSKLRYRRLLSKLPSTNVTPDETENIEDGVDAASRSLGVQEAFLALGKRDQEILTLCVLEELPTAEVAQILNIPPGTVKSRLSRGKQHLISSLRESQFAPRATPAAEGSI